jgi:hypothetical protein
MLPLADSETFEDIPSIARSSESTSVVDHWPEALIHRTGSHETNDNESMTFAKATIKLVRIFTILQHSAHCGAYP